MGNYNLAEKILQEHRIDFQANAPLSNYTSFKIGGNGRLITFPKNAEEISVILSVCNQEKLPKLILGNGSNVLICDDGYAGVVLVLNRSFTEIHLIDETTIEASAGASLMMVCRFAAEHGLTGLEFAYGIPATVGGAVYMNAGAYGGEMKDVLQSASHITPFGDQGSFAGEDLKLSYRHSAYTDTEYCIVSAVFRLKKGDPTEINSRMEDILGRRKSKQPLEFPSAGSTFKRPPNAFAAKLIEDCGLKGRMLGGAQVSEKHSGFVINTGKATCQDVLELIQTVQQEVREQTGIDLECEVKYIG